MACFTELNVQEVGKLLGLTLGTNIHPAIEPGIRALQEKLASAGAALHVAKSVLSMVDYLSQEQFTDFKRNFFKALNNTKP